MGDIFRCNTVSRIDNLENNIAVLLGNRESDLAAFRRILEGIAKDIDEWQSSGVLYLP